MGSNSAWGACVNKHTLEAGDGLSVEYGGRLEFSGGNAAEFILFDLA